MTKEKVEELRVEYLKLREADWHNYYRKTEYYVFELGKPDYVWLCSSLRAAIARVAYWNADAELSGTSDRYGVQKGTLIKREDGTQTREYEIIDLSSTIQSRKEKK